MCAEAKVVSEKSACKHAYRCWEKPSSGSLAAECDIKITIGENYHVMYAADVIT